VDFVHMANKVAELVAQFFFSQSSRTNLLFFTQINKIIGTWMIVNTDHGVSE